jgi:hypothetical protein
MFLHTSLMSYAEYFSISSIKFVAYLMHATYFLSYLTVVNLTEYTHVSTSLSLYYYEHYHCHLWLQCLPLPTEKPVFQTQNVPFQSDKEMLPCH